LPGVTLSIASEGLLNLISLPSLSFRLFIFVVSFWIAVPVDLFGKSNACRFPLFWVAYRFSGSFGVVISGHLFPECFAAIGGPHLRFFSRYSMEFVSFIF